MLRGLPRRRGCLIFHALRGAAVGLAVVLGVHFAYIFLGSNFRTVIPGQAYRCNQPSFAQLERIVGQQGIRTVVNLRGTCPGLPWYRAEADATARLDLAQEDVSMSAIRLPPSTSVRQLVEVLDRAEYPILLHCQQGADRTGLAAVMVLLLRTNTPLDQALWQLSPVGGHIPLGRTARISTFFTLYRRWLASTTQTHSSAAFRAWAKEHYCPDAGRATFALLEPAGRELRLTPELHERVTIRCHNTSVAAWHFHPGGTAGVHGAWVILDRDERLVAAGKTGLRHATVEPGAAIDLDVAVPPLPAGMYEFRFDLIDERHASFLQLGNDVLRVEVVVY